MRLLKWSEHLIQVIEASKYNEFSMDLSLFQNLGFTISWFWTSKKKTQNLFSQIDYLIKENFFRPKISHNDQRSRSGSQIQETENCLICS